MLKWYLTEEAQVDMKDIRTFTKQCWGGMQSARYIKEIREKINLLAQNPRLVFDRSVDLGKNIRSIPIGSHMIYYEFNVAELYVRGILHQAMVPDKYLQQK
jgi:toxin ParE1/3/4